MQHKRCNQHGCWLLACSTLLQAPEPKFLLGQSVQLYYVNEFGSRLGPDRGIVTGLIWNSPDFEPSWCYQVEWYELRTSDWLPLPHIAIEFEADLEPCGADS